MYRAEDYSGMHKSTKNKFRVCRHITANMKSYTKLKTKYLTDKKIEKAYIKLGHKFAIVESLIKKHTKH